jgi:salicylate hydroxylase
VNVVAVTEGGSARQGWNETADSGSLRASFTRWAKESKSLLNRAEGWRSWSLFRLAPGPRWSAGRVTLLGDAAHPVLPYLAQGAALAIEDAATLAASLARSPDDPSAAFSQYEGERQARAAYVQRAARRLGRLYHLRGALRLARNAILARRSDADALRRFDWLYEGQREG